MHFLISSPVYDFVHGLRETRLEAGLSASGGTPPPFKDQGAAAAPKAVGGE